jgi:hypothetical protein
VEEEITMWEIYVPTVKNGNLGHYTTKFHQMWDEKVLKISGGLTILRPAIGQWLSPYGTLFKERMIPVRIMCTVEQIESIADLTASHYDQIAILYFKLGEGRIKHYSSKK